MNGTFFVVATPIGNLDDMTFRAVEILNEVDVIACEDTRVTKVLLEHFDISTPTISYHQHSSDAKAEAIIQRLERGENVALVSDAGTPGISDPGNKLVQEIVARGLRVVPVPGVSAVTTLLSVAGMPTDSFWFAGFVPHKKGRQTLFTAIAESKETVVVYESKHRIIKTLEQLSEHLDPARQLVVGRELTKLHEEIIRGTTAEILTHLQEGVAKGEFVIIIQGD